MIVFQNPGILDVRCITTQGINVKDDEETAIGQFGTGLKIAIAVMLRTEHTVEINTGDMTYKFFTVNQVVRGKEFQFIVMEPTRSIFEGGETNYVSEANITLGFTTDFGKHWEKWMAYREFYSNCMDEKGTIEILTEIDTPYHGTEMTTIVITGPDIDAIHKNRHQYFLTGDPIWEDDNVAIHTAQAGRVFYQGIWAGNLEPDPAFAYNIKCKAELTEDRTFKNLYAVKHLITFALLACDNREVLTEAIPNKLEFAFDYDWPGHDVNPVLESLAMQRIKDKDGLPSSLRAALRKLRGKDFDELALEVPNSLSNMLLSEPEISRDSLPSSSGIYSYISQMEQRIKELTLQNTYWKLCIKKLAEAEDMEQRLQADVDHTPIQFVTGKADMAHLSPETLAAIAQHVEGGSEPDEGPSVEDLAKDL